MFPRVTLPLHRREPWPIAASIARSAGSESADSCAARVERVPRVAVDLRILDRPGMERTGVGRYALETARALAAVRPDWELVLHTQRSDLVPALAARVKARLQTCWGSAAGL